MGLFIGFCLVALLGVAHHFALIFLKNRTARAKEYPNVAMISVFLGLSLLHLAEILAFAAAYRLLLMWDGMGTLGGSFGGSWSGFIYFSGINFATLGYTQIETEGPIRLVNMMQSLGGFMVLTWSATFTYSIWKKALESH